ncbi:hypothetical protein SAMN05421666_3301 [Roseovarius nanhaiticus]|uniref:Flagellar FliJ protein n=1 Tax=Roseovarius nanhaiticus TaxID=573024 RepID=A0A1N7HKX2_9RHOB|nr:hypothetical protein [Roseovarius nanhaiticus]SEL26889.1 hypothetical protein SAMN05216208_3277 [Roseovarius nanhaiticus]SIS25524.1 hypothetical protein SAMN05421666_3301 [Roseovarius nanhaiticus]
MTDRVQLSQAMEAAYQAAQAAMQDIRAEETALRQSLAELDAQRMASRALPLEQWAAPRAIGADLLWQGWTQRTRQELNVKLAQVLVRKAEKLAALRHAFGRAEAVRRIIEDERKARRKAAQGRDLERDQYLALMNGPTSAGGQNR